MIVLQRKVTDYENEGKCTKSVLLTANQSTLWFSIYRHWAPGNTLCLGRSPAGSASSAG